GGSPARPGLRRPAQRGELRVAVDGGARRARVRGGVPGPRPGRPRPGPRHPRDRGPPGGDGPSGRRRGRLPAGAQRMSTAHPQTTGRDEAGPDEAGQASPRQAGAGPDQPLTAPEVPVDLAPLAAVLSPGALVEDADIIAAHTQDRAVFAPSGRARALIRARSTEDVQEALRFAHEHRLPVIPQGALTGLSGGANGIDGALLLNVAQLDDILDIDTVEQTATVQPGVINRALKDALAPHGLAYPPDPGSVDISTIGGNVATNAGGLCCVKYGVTKDYVRR